MQIQRPKPLKSEPWKHSGCQGWNWEETGSTLRLTRHLQRVKWAHPSFDTGVFQSRAPGASGGDERREAGDSDDAHTGRVQGLPDEGGVQEDDGEEVRRSLTLLTHPAC